MRLFHILKENPPGALDYLSYEAQGKVPPKRASEELKRSWRAVSTVTTLETAWEYAAVYDLGEFVAELEVPDHVQRYSDRPWHVLLENTTPAELDSYRMQIHAREAKVKS
jgi:hypothetical protein